MASGDILISNILASDILSSAKGFLISDNLATDIFTKDNLAYVILAKAVSVD
jgi:hypothetical protein